MFRKKKSSRGLRFKDRKNRIKNIISTGVKHTASQMDNDTDDDNVDNGCKDKDEDNINDGNKHEDEDNISNGSNNEDGDEDDDGTVEDNDEDVDAEDESDTATIAQEKTRTAAENRPNEVESPCM